MKTLLLEAELNCMPYSVFAECLNTLESTIPMPYCDAFQGGLFVYLDFYKRLIAALTPSEQSCCILL